MPHDEASNVAATCSNDDDSDGEGKADIRGCEPEVHNPHA